MSDEPNYAAQCIELDFGGEVPYAFNHLPINNQLNREMFARAVERARRKRLSVTEALPEKTKSL